MAEHLSNESLWQVSVSPVSETDARSRSRLLDYIRPHLERHVAQSPLSREFVLQTPFGSIRAELQAGAMSPSGAMRLTYAGRAPLAPSTPAADEIAHLTRLPDAGIAALGGRLIGLDAVIDDVMLRMSLLWDGRARAWCEQTGHVLPPALRAYLDDALACFLFEGPPGTGKSLTARFLCDRYCRYSGAEGILITLPTDKGSGLVGELSAKLREGFKAVHDAPEGTFVAILIDELDNWGETRSYSHQHKEDKGGVLALIQELDRLKGARRKLVLFTTNVGGSIDPAILRRTVSYKFERPGREVLLELLSRWLPALSPAELQQAARRARGLTPADMDRALSGLWMEAMKAGTLVTAAAARRCLASAPRTRDV